MNNLLSKLFILFLSVGVISSCSTSKKAGKISSTAPTEKALLWKIEKGDMSPSYLYGTIHIIPSEDFFYPKGTLQAIESTEKMVFEIDMSVMSDMSAQMALMSKAVMKDGKTLRDFTTQEEYDLIKAHFDKMGLPLALFERMKPAFLSVFASEEMSPNAMQSGEMKSYEMGFMEIANTQKMELGGLETVEYQLSVFDSIPYLDQAKMLVESIKSTNSGDDDFKKMIDIYKDQDLKGMGEMFSDETLGDMDLLLNNRNKNWIPVMKEYMAKEPVFFAVGAGHLVGDEGVISLLRKQGYKMTPIIEE